jgi:tetratricopeptide (TPR) repeat protein
MATDVDQTAETKRVAREYFEAHVKKFQKEPDRWASAHCWASLQILQAAIEKVGVDRKAIRDFDESLRLKPDRVGALSGRAYAWLKKGDYTRALTDLDQALQLNPDDMALVYDRGALHAQKGNYVQAIADFTQVIRLDAKDADAFHGRGIAYAVLDEVLGPLRELAQRGEYAHEATYQAYMKPLSECDCGLVELRALCRELLS